MFNKKCYVPVLSKLTAGGREWSCLKNKWFGLFIYFPLSLYFRYLQPPAAWLQCALESRELLSLCLKKIKASLSKVSHAYVYFCMNFS